MTIVETQIGKKLKKLKTDNGLEFVNQEFNDFCKVNGIVRHKTVRHTPQQNGLYETMNMTTLEKLRNMLSSSKLPLKFWAEIAHTVVYIPHY